MPSDYEHFGHLTPKPFASESHSQKILEHVSGNFSVHSAKRGQSLKLEEKCWLSFSILISPRGAAGGSGQGLCRIISWLGRRTTLVVKNLKYIYKKKQGGSLNFDFFTGVENVFQRFI